MDAFWEFAGNYWWLVFPLGGIVGGWVGGIGKYNEKRRKDKIEMLRIKHGAQQAEVEAKQVTDKQIDRALTTHDEVNKRWFSYEIDMTKLIDYPLMTDMREPLTTDFHRARVTADDLRPDDRDELRDPSTLAEYTEAVRAYRVAFDIAEREAQRRRQSGFSESERTSLERARKLVAMAIDEGATPAERQNAYRRARQELDGLIVLPQPAIAALEGRIAGAIEAGS